MVASVDSKEVSYRTARAVVGRKGTGKARGGAERAARSRGKVTQAAVEAARGTTLQAVT